MSSSRHVALLDRLARACARTPDAEIPSFGSTSLSDFGLTSEAAASAFIADVQSSLGEAACASLTIEACLENPTIEDLAALISSTSLTSEVKKGRGCYNAMRTKLLPLTAMAMLVAPGAAFEKGLGFELDAKGCVKNYNSETDYYPAARRSMFVKDDVGYVDREAFGYADYFTIEYFKTYQIVRNTAAIASGKNATYVLHHCGTPLSTLDDLPADAKHAPVWEVPVQSVTTDNTVAFAYAEFLDQIDKVKIADLTYISSPCAQKLFMCNNSDPDIIGGNDMHNAAGNTAGYSAIASDDGVWSTVHFVDSDKASLKHDVIFSASADPSLLGRCQWSFYAAAWLNIAPEATRRFRMVETNLYQTQVSVANAQRHGASQPVIAFVSYTAACNPCSCCGGYEWYNDESWTFQRAKYKREAILKAGGQPVAVEELTGPDWSGPATGNIKTASVAALHKVLRGVDVLVDETYAADNFAYTMETFYTNYMLSADDTSDFTFLANKEVLRLDATIGQFFGEDASQGMSWYEHGVIRADYFVEELAGYAIFNVQPADHPIKFFRNLILGEMPRVLDASDVLDPYCVCEGEDAPAHPDPVYNDCVDDICIIQALSTLPAPPPPPPSPEAPPSPPPPPTLPPTPLGLKEDDDDSLGAGVIAAIVIVAAVALLLAAGVFMLISREKSGTPIFSSVVVDSKGAAA